MTEGSERLDAGEVITDNFDAANARRIEGYVFASLRPGELRLIMGPAVGLLDGGAVFDVPTGQVPVGSRLPNSALWLTNNSELGRLVKIESRAGWVWAGGEIGFSPTP